MPNRCLKALIKNITPSLGPPLHLQENESTVCCSTSVWGEMRVLFVILITFSYASTGRRNENWQKKKTPPLPSCMSNTDFLQLRYIWKSEQYNVGDASARCWTKSLDPPLGRQSEDFFPPGFAICFKVLKYGLMHKLFSQQLPKSLLEWGHFTWSRRIERKQYVYCGAKTFELHTWFSHTTSPLQSFE